MPSSTAVFRAVADFTSLNKAVRDARKEIRGLDRDLKKVSSNSDNIDKSFSRMATSQGKLSASTNALATSQRALNKSFKDTVADSGKATTASSNAHKRLRDNVKSTTTAINALTKAEKAASMAAASHTKALTNERTSASAKRRVLNNLSESIAKVASNEKDAAAGARSHVSALDKEAKSAKTAAINKRDLAKALERSAALADSSADAHDKLAGSLDRVGYSLGLSTQSATRRADAEREAGAVARTSSADHDRLATALTRMRSESDGVAPSVAGLRTALQGTGPAASSAGTGLTSAGRSLGVFSTAGSNAMRVGTALRVVLYGLVGVGIGPAIQLIVGSLVSLAGALVGVAGAAGPMVGALGAIPTLMMSLGGAMATWKLAFAGLDKPMAALGKAMSGGKKEADAFKKSLEGLPKPAQDFLNSIFKLKPAFDQLKNTAQSNLFPGLTNAINTLAPMIKSVAVPAVKEFATVLGSLAQRGASMVKGFEGPLKTFFTTAAPQIVDQIGQSLINLGSAFISVGLGASEFTKWMATAFQEVTAGWAQAAEKARTNGDMTAFFNEAKAALQLFGSTLFEVGRVLSSVFGGAAPMGRELLTSFRDATRETANFLKSSQGIAVVNDYFMKLKPNIEIIFRLLGQLGMALIKVGVSPGLTAMLQTIERDLAPALSRFTREFGQAMEKVGPLVIKLFAKILDIASNLMDLGEGGFLQGFVLALTALATVLEWLTSIPGVAQLIATLMGIAGAMAAIKAIGTLTGLSKLGRGLNSVAGGAASRAQAAQGGKKGPKTFAGGFGQGLYGTAGKEPRTGTARVGAAAGGGLRRAGSATKGFFQSSPNPNAIKPGQQLGLWGDPQDKQASQAQQAIQRVGDAAKTMQQGASTAMKAVGKDIADVGKEVAKGYKEGADSGRKFASDLGKSAETGSKQYTDKLSKAIDAVNKKFDATPSRVEKVANSAAKLADRTSQALRKISEGTDSKNQPGMMERAVWKGIDKLNKGLDSMADKSMSTISKVGQGLDRIADKTVGGILKANQGFNNIADRTINGFTRIGDGLNTMSDKAANGLVKMGDGLNKMSDKTVNGLVKMGSTMGKVADSTVSGVGRAFTAWENLNKNTIEKGIFEGIPKAIDGLEKGLNTAGQKVANGARAVGSAVKNIPTTIRAAAAGAASAADSLSKSFTNIGPRITQSLAGIRTAITTGLQSGLQQIPTLVNGAVSSLGRIAAPVTGAVTAFRNLGTSLSGFGTTFGAARTAMQQVQQQMQQMGTSLPVLTQMRQAFLNAQQGATGFKGTAGVIAAGATGIKGALSGLSGALGGPWGIAIAGAVTALGLLATSQENAKQKAQEHQQAIQELAGTLDQVSGAVTQQTVSQKAQELSTKKIADGSKTYLEALKEINVSLPDYTQASLGNADALGRVQQQLDAHIAGLLQASPLYGDIGKDLGLVGVTLQDLTAAAQGNPVAMAKVEDGIKRISTAGPEALASNRSLAQSLLAVAGDAGKLGNELGISNGKLKEAQSQTKLAAEAAQDFSAKMDSMKVALQGLSSGSPPTQQLLDNMVQLGVAATNTANIMQGKMAAAGGNAVQQTEAFNQSLVESANAFRQMATDARVPQPIIDQLIAKMGLIPKDVPSLTFTTNADTILPKLQEIQTAINSVPAGTKTVTVALSDPAIIQQLEAIGLKVTTLPNGQVQIDLNDQAAVTAYNNFVALVQDKAVITNLDANTATADGKINATIQLANGKTAELKLDANPELVNGKIQAAVDLGNGKIVNMTIDANDQPVQGKIQAVITSADGKKTTILLEGDDKQLAGLIDKYQTLPPVTQPVTPGPMEPAKPTGPTEQPVTPGPMEPAKPGGTTEQPVKPTPDPMPSPAPGAPVEQPVEPGKMPPPDPSKTPIEQPVKPGPMEPPKPAPAVEQPIKPGAMGPVPAPPAVTVPISWGSATNTIVAPPAQVVALSWGAPTGTIPKPPAQNVDVTLTPKDNVTSVINKLKTATSSTHTINVTDNATTILNNLKLATTSTHTINVVDNATPVINNIKNPTTSTHTIEVVDNATPVLESLNGMQTSSVHTVQIVTQGALPGGSGGGVVPYAGGGPVPYAGGGVQRFAPGGVIRGFSPGRDTVPAVLSPGEAVLVPELVQALGARNIIKANKLASNRQGSTQSGDRAAMSGTGPHFGGMSPIKGMAQMLGQLMNKPVVGKYAKGGMVNGFARGGRVDGKTTNYKIRRGDTLWSISDKYGVAPNIIVEANQKTLGQNQTLQAGTRISIPRYPQRPATEQDENTTNVTTGGWGVDDPASFQNLNEWMAEVNRSNAERAEFERNVLTIAGWGFDDLALALSEMGVGDLHSSGSRSYEVANPRYRPPADDGTGTSSGSSEPETIQKTIQYTDIGEKTKSGLLLSREAVASRSKAAEMERLIEEQKDFLNDNLALVIKVIGALQKAVGLGIREVSVETELSTEDIFKAMKKASARAEIEKLPMENKSKFLANLSAYERGEAFARGGRVFGTGNRDTVPAWLTPGEFVIRKPAAEALGSTALERLNRADKSAPPPAFSAGGAVPHAAELFSVMGRPGVARVGSRSGQSQLAAAMNANATSTTDMSKQVVFQEGSVQIQNPAPARATDSFGNVMTKLSWSGAFS